MKLTSAERAQIEKQRAEQKKKLEQVMAARQTLSNVSDSLAVELARQIEASNKYFGARDACGCLKRTDELCRSCKRLFDQWFFRRIR